MTSYTVLDSTSLPSVTLILSKPVQTPKEKTQNFPGYTYFRRQIMPKDHTGTTFRVNYIHIPPIQPGSHFYPVAFPAELRTAITNAVQGIDLGGEVYGQLWWKHSEVKHAISIGPDKATVDVRLEGYQGRGVKGVGHLSIYLRGKKPDNSLQAVPDSWTFHIDVSILHVTSFSNETPLSGCEIASQDFISELLKGVTLTSYVTLIIGRFLSLTKQ